ncbi:MAG: 50S ribosomal protein L22 [Chloroflexi bacterium]|jgi:large subunit ribosomal protein L22|nr:50S ribosomal protein L22 [Chloroflexota bacterium]
MEVKSTAKGVRVSPKKVRRVVDLVRGKGADEALAVLNFMPSPIARTVSRVVKSAVASAENNYQMTPSELKITRAYVDEGTRMKRVRFAGRGRVSPILKRSCHITVVVEEI